MMDMSRGLGLGAAASSGVVSPDRSVVCEGPLGSGAS